MLEHAVELAARGWAVFPLIPNDKRPLTKHGFLDASTDEAQIVKWWTENPNAGIGIATGAKSGIIVLDVDPRNGGAESLRAIESKYGPLPATFSVVTGGGGSHYYFRHPGGTVRCAATLGGNPGIDLKGDGGYVVAPPSVHPSGKTYSWDLTGHPDDLITMSDAPPWVLVAKVSKEEVVPAEGHHKIPEGRRDNYLASVAGGLRAKGMPAEAIYEALKTVNSTMLSAPLPERDLQRISSSIGKYSYPSNGIDERASEFTTEDIENAVCTRTWLHTAELGKPPSVLGEGIIVEDSFTLLHGDEGLGKTWLALHLAYCIALGQPFLGIPTIKKRVLYLGSEINTYLLKPRMDQVDRLITPEGAVPVYACDDMEYLVPPRWRKHVDLGDPKCTGELARYCETHSIGVFVFDPYSDFCDGDENSTRDMAQVVVHGMGIIKQAGATPIAVHHNRKGPPDGQDSAKNAVRGAKKIRTSAQCVMSLWEDRGLYRLEFSKLNHAPPQEPIWLRAQEDGGFAVTDPPPDKKAEKEGRKYNLIAAMSNGLWQGINQIADDPRLAGIGSHTVRRYIQELISDGRAEASKTRPVCYRLVR